MSETWHTERMYIQTENGTFVAQAFSLEDAAAIVREHNAFPVMLAALKAALALVKHGADSARLHNAVDILEAAIAKAEGGEK